MRDKFTAEEYKEIEKLVKFAITAPTKAEAKKYSDKLNHIGYDVVAYSRNVFHELIAATVTALGSITDKERLVKDARDNLLKFKISCVEKK